MQRHMIIENSSPEKQAQYVNLLKTLCCWISIVQIIMLIVAFAMGGIAPLSQNPSIGPGAPTLITLGMIKLTVSHS